VRTALAACSTRRSSSTASSVGAAAGRSRGWSVGTQGRVSSGSPGGETVGRRRPVSPPAALRAAGAGSTAELSAAARRPAMLSAGEFAELSRPPHAAAATAIAVHPIHRVISIRFGFVIMKDLPAGATTVPTAGR
jgi:hypothetical protein